MKPNNASARCGAYFVCTFFVLLSLVSSPPLVCAASAVCAALHELAHMACARALGRRVRPLSFSLTGLYPDTGKGSVLSCILIYAAGPAVNILVCLVCIFLMRQSMYPMAFDLFSVNAVLAAYNLTPVPFSDGGGILRCILGEALGSRAGHAVCSVIELVFSFVFFVFFSYRFFMSGRGFFPFFCSFVFMLASLQGSSRE